MDYRTQVIPIAGLLATIACAGYQVAQLNAQSAFPAGFDVAAATLVEVRDAGGQAVLRGQFGTANGGRERHAALGPAGADTRVMGEAELEPREIEVSIRNAAPRATYTVVIDGREIGTLTTNRHGRGELDVDAGTFAAASGGRCS